jgi:peroxiredoxin
MSKGLNVGARIPDFELPDENGEQHRLSDLQGDNLMVLQLGRGEHCPRERQHHKHLLGLQEIVPVAFTTLVTILPNQAHDVFKLKASTGAWWTFLCDTDLDVQRTFEIDEYTDTHHAATVPHTLVLAPGLVIDTVYCGYWFWGRPSVAQLWADMGDLLRRTAVDYDPTTPKARAAWRAAQGETIPRARSGGSKRSRPRASR